MLLAIIYLFILFIYTTFIKRSIHKQTCSNALFNKYIYTVVSIVDIILLINNRSILYFTLRLLSNDNFKHHRIIKFII